MYKLEKYKHKLMMVKGGGGWLVSKVTDPYLDDYEQKRVYKREYKRLKWVGGAESSSSTAVKNCTHCEGRGYVMKIRQTGVIQGQEVKMSCDVCSGSRSIALDVTPVIIDAQQMKEKWQEDVKSQTTSTASSFLSDLKTLLYPVKTQCNVNRELLFHMLLHLINDDYNGQLRASGTKTLVLISSSLMEMVKNIILVILTDENRKIQDNSPHLEVTINHGRRATFHLAELATFHKSPFKETKYGTVFAVIAGNDDSPLLDQTLNECAEKISLIVSLSLKSDFPKTLVLDNSISQKTIELMHSLFTRYIHNNNFEKLKETLDFLQDVLRIQILHHKDARDQTLFFDVMIQFTEGETALKWINLLLKYHNGNYQENVFKDAIYTDTIVMDALLKRMDKNTSNNLQFLNEALYFAAAYGKLEHCKLLVNHGANLNLVKIMDDGREMNAKKIAQENGMTDVVTFLHLC